MAAVFYASFFLTVALRADATLPGEHAEALPFRSDIERSSTSTIPPLRSGTATPISTSITRIVRVPHAQHF